MKPNVGFRIAYLLLILNFSLLQLDANAYHPSKFERVIGPLLGFIVFFLYLAFCFGTAYPAALCVEYLGLVYSPGLFLIFISVLIFSFMDLFTTHGVVKFLIGIPFIIGALNYFLSDFFTSDLLPHSLKRIEKNRRKDQFLSVLILCSIFFVILFKLSIKLLDIFSAQLR